MPKIEITRTELVWPGKYDEDGNLVATRRVSLPFQVIERVNETRATREQREDDKKGHLATLFDYWQDEKAQNTDPGDGWRNKLIWGDNLYVMGSLLEKFSSKVDLIYIDPPFTTGADFRVKTQLGDEDITKEQSIIEEKAYRDTWREGLSSFLAMLRNRFILMRELLTGCGGIYIHLDWRTVHHVKLVGDDVFGYENFLNEVVWCYSERELSTDHWNRKHDCILYYVKNKDEKHIFNWQNVAHEYSQGTIEKFKYKDDDGRLFQIRGKNVKESPYKGKHGLHLELEHTNPDWVYRDYLDEKEGIRPRDWWSDIPFVNRAAQERTGYPTQKPEPLLERIISASSNPSSIVADFFCGSGTTLAVAEKLGRRWIGCDMGRYAIHTTRKRLMEIPDCKPFEVLNLGKYERQVWQGVTFEGQKQAQQMLIFEYLKFILELYGAQPLAGTQVLHGKKGSAVVHVGAVDAPVTIDEVLACLAECKQMGQKELHILGWEWEMGLANLMVDEARGMGIKLLMLTIPREVMEQQAVEKGDIHFYELAYLEARIEIKGKTVSIELADFVIPNDELIPPEVREKIKKWSDYVDYWAIDWDFQNDTFVNGWTSYRTRKERTLQLKSEAHEYPAAGTYQMVVKAIDIFGNDTSQVFVVEI